MRGKELVWISRVCYAASLVLVGLAAYRRMGDHSGVNYLDSSRVRILLEDREDQTSVRQGKTLVVTYVDFQCPYCRAELPRVMKIPAIASRRVPLSIRQLPLTSIHSYAYPAAVLFEASRSFASDERQVATELCSRDLKRFFGSMSQLDSFTAGRLNPNRTAIARNAVEEDVRAATRLKVSGTPTYFVVQSEQRAFRAEGEIALRRALEDL